MSNVINLAIIAIGLSGTLSAAPSLAQPSSVTIRTADLNLAAPAGQQALHSRVLRAVARVCGPIDLRDLKAVTATRACRAASLARVASQMQTVASDARSDPAYAASDTEVASSAY